MIGERRCQCGGIMDHEGDKERAFWKCLDCGKIIDDPGPGVHCAYAETKVTPLVSDNNAFLVELRPEDREIVTRYKQKHPGTDTATVVWLAVVTGIAELERH